MASPRRGDEREERAHENEGNRKEDDAAVQDQLDGTSEVLKRLHIRSMAHSALAIMH